MRFIYISETQLLIQAWYLNYRIQNVHCSGFSVDIWLSFSTPANNIYSVTHQSVGFTIKEQWECHFSMSVFEQLLYNLCLSLSYSINVKHNNKCIRFEHSLLSYPDTPCLSLINIREKGHSWAILLKLTACQQSFRLIFLKGYKHLSTTATPVLHHIFKTVFFSLTDCHGSQVNSIYMDQYHKS